MRKEIFLSFKPEFFRPILYGIKKYEYRKRFGNEEVRAYLYLSAPIKKVIGILELGKPIIIEEVISKYEKNSEQYKRLKECLDNKEKYAIPIKSFRLIKNPIGIEKIKKIEKFNVPQCYLNLKNYSKILEYLKEQEYYEKEFENEHNRIYENNIGMSCKEMEQTREFKKVDEQYNSNKKYDIVETKYLTK